MADTFDILRRPIDDVAAPKNCFFEIREEEPTHGPGEDPYTVHEYRPLLDAFTIQDGSMREMPGGA